MAKTKAVEREHMERVDRAFKYLNEERGWTKINLALTVDDYEQVQGLEKAYALDRFIDYAEAHDMEAGAIAATLGHDLMGRHKACFSPRTSRY